MKNTYTTEEKIILIAIIQHIIYLISIFILVTPKFFRQMCGVCLVEYQT